MDNVPLLPNRRRSRVTGSWANFCALAIAALVAAGAVAALIALLLTVGRNAPASGIFTPCCVNQTVNDCKLGFSIRYNQSSDYSAIAYDVGVDKMLRIATLASGAAHTIFYANQLDGMMVNEEAPLADTLASGLVYRGVAKSEAGFYVLGDNTVLEMDPSGQLLGTIAQLSYGPLYQDLLAVDSRLFTIADTVRLLEINTVNGAVKRMMPIHGDATHIMALTFNRNEAFVLMTNHSGTGAPQQLGRIDLVTGKVSRCYEFGPSWDYIAVKFGSNDELWVSGAPPTGFPSLGVLPCGPF